MSWLSSDDLWIVATALCCAVNCGVLGCFLVLQRLSLLGDAMSHAILPGLAVAFIFTGSRSVTAMLVGAGVAALVTAGVSGGLRRVGRVNEDSALGVVFTTMFALGVLLITWVAARIDLDPGCVLYGLLELVPFDTVVLLGVDVPRAFLWLAVNLVLLVLLVALFFKELRLVCFDADLATALGFRAAAVNVGLLSLVAATTVVSFEAVGSILVVALLVGPAATAQLLTDRLARMPWIAAGVGALSAILGYALALHWNTSVAGMMSVVVGVIFVLAALFAPRHGVVMRRVHRLRLTLRIAREDLLADLYRQHELAIGVVCPAEVSSDAAPSAPAEHRNAPGGSPARSTWIRRLALRELLAGGLAMRGRGPGHDLQLTDRGRQVAQELIRVHRLWESYLSQDLGLAADHLHAPAHREEHFIAGELLEALEREVAARTDPHGKPIPGRSEPSI